MYDDFDYLAKTIIPQVFAQLPFREQATGYHITDSIMACRNKIEYIKEDGEFGYFIQRVLNYTLDGHSNIAEPAEAAGMMKNLQEIEAAGLKHFVDTSYFTASKQMLQKYFSFAFKRLSGIEFFLYVRYIDGEYYNVIPIKLKDKIIPTGNVIKIKTKVVVNDSPITCKYLGIDKDSATILKVPFLKNERNYILTDNAEMETYLPQTTGLGYKGKIYLLQDENIFSSAGAISALAYYTDQIVSIGESSGWMGGWGLPRFSSCYPTQN